ncbi:putative 60s ribosomal protein rml2 [Phaeomoniella chlamydospora]|uniref:Large ribosomal subunit protein uL2m n=1 Tax=Phaeomoniella chlamydospora TaxID=158046 RepID=A0A0G2ERV5_PHACM|nr:putative 60s ribosomal protein rml2 [Phaeomoniella chlamydospora]
MHGVDLVRYKPRTPGTRHLVRPRNEHLWKGRPFHPLTVPKKGLGQAGRNNTGHITVRHRGGGHKRRIRIIDFYRNEPGTHIVERIEYDPNRSAHIALLTSQVTGRKSYIIAADGMRAGDLVESYRKGIPKTLIDAMGGQIDHGVLAAKTALRGNCLPLSMIPQGVPIYNIAYTPDGPAQVCRSAGTYAVIVAKGEDQVDKDLKKLKANAESGDYLSKMPIAELAKLQKTAKYVSVRLSSGEVRLFDKQACATIGVASNRNFNRQQLGKAGRSRWLGIRPTVRGLAMNANEHPHGGGRGKSKGNVHPKSPWGMPAKSGYKTRPKDKPNKMVVKERPRNQGQRRRGRQ